ncbi:hypothetical protein Tco_0328992 [Tanacetum coccineum]
MLFQGNDKSTYVVVVGTSLTSKKNGGGDGREMAMSNNKKGVKHHADQFEETKRMIYSLASKDFSSYKYMFYYNLIDEDSYRGSDQGSNPSIVSKLMGAMMVVGTRKKLNNNILEEGGKNYMKSDIYGGEDKMKPFLSCSSSTKDLEYVVYNDSETRIFAEAKKNFINHRRRNKEKFSDTRKATKAMFEQQTKEDTRKRMESLKLKGILAMSCIFLDGGNLNHLMWKRASLSNALLLNSQMGDVEEFGQQESLSNGLKTGQRVMECL